MVAQAGIEPAIRESKSLALTIWRLGNIKSGVFAPRNGVLFTSHVDYKVPYAAEHKPLFMDLEKL